MPIRQRYEHGPVLGARVGRFNAGINTTFVVYRVGETVIDTGPTNQWRPVRRFLDESPVVQLLLTHHHEDHSGNARRIGQRYGLKPLAPLESRDKLARGYRTPPMQRLIWGRPQPVETNPLPCQLTLPAGLELQAIPTPGHSRDLHCLFVPDEGWLFSGDLYISRSLRYLRADENLGQILDSIRKVLELDFDRLFCPHRGIKSGGWQAMKDKEQNIMELCGRCQELQRQGLDLPEIVSQVVGPDGLLARLTGYNFSKTNLIREALAVRC